MLPSLYAALLAGVRKTLSVRVRIYIYTVRRVFIEISSDFQCFRGARTRN